MTSDDPAHQSAQHPVEDYFADLIAVIDRAYQEDAAAEQYIDHAGGAALSELRNFFQDIQMEARKRGDRGMELALLLAKNYLDGRYS